MENQVRVMLWCVPRTCSTSFAVCMSYLDGVQVISQPYVSALLVGPDIQKEEAIDELRRNMNKITANVRVNCNDLWESECLSYKYVKENILEADYPDKKVVFVKDISNAVTDRLDMLPKGYRHAFLIRSPDKVFSSFKNYLNKFNSREDVMLTAGKGSTGIIAQHYEFGESLQLYEHLIKTGIEPLPFIIDADDLLENPESILRQFCSFAGIEYTDKLLTWDRGRDVIKPWKTSKEMLQWNEVGDWHSRAFTSKGFGKPKLAPPRSEMSEDVLYCIDASLPFYRKLYKLRANIKNQNI